MRPNWQLNKYREDAMKKKRFAKVEKPESLTNCAVRSTVPQYFPNPEGKNTSNEKSY